MKKVLSILFVFCCAAAVQGQPSANLHKVLQARTASQQALLDHVRFAPTVDFNKEDSFGNTPLFAAALKGDVKSILWLQNVAPNGEYLLKTGKDGNNVLHVARDRKTFETLLRLSAIFIRSIFRPGCSNCWSRKTICRKPRSAPSLIMAEETFLLNISLKPSCLPVCLRCRPSWTRAVW